MTDQSGTPGANFKSAHSRVLSILVQPNLPSFVKILAQTGNGRKSKSLPTIRLLSKADAFRPRPAGKVRIAFSREATRKFIRRARLDFRRTHSMNLGLAPHRAKLFQSSRAPQQPEASLQQRDLTRCKPTKGSLRVNARASTAPTFK